MTSLPPVSLRAATMNDRRTVWDWRNGFVSRDLYEPDQDITYGQYQDWFDGALEDDTQALMIGHIQSVRIALIWCRQPMPDEWTIQLFLKPGFCGKGVLSDVLARTTEYLRDEREAMRLMGCFANINPATAYAFELCGFECDADGPVVNCHLEIRGRELS